MAWNRTVQLAIAAPADFAVDRIGVEISDLHIDFNVSRSIKYSDNVAEFTIYNAASTTRNEILKEAASVVFKAGYEDLGMKTIFIGNVFEAESRKVGVDWVTKVRAASNRSEGQTLENSLIAISREAGSTLASVLEIIGNALGLVVYGVENANIILPNGYTDAGSVRNALNYCQSILRDNGAALFIDNSELVVYKTGNSDSRYATVILDYESGLLSLENVTETDAGKATDVQKQKRIKYKALLNPNLQPNGVVTISVDNKVETYINESLVFSGNNYGGDFYVSGEAVA